MQYSYKIGHGGLFCGGVFVWWCVKTHSNYDTSHYHWIGETNYHEFEELLLIDLSSDELS
ncbi:MAG: hypothetical protein RIA69_08825 [Cyclobacteriaceae bacterium]